jgi:hypothetical protein
MFSARGIDMPFHLKNVLSKRRSHIETTWVRH